MNYVIDFWHFILFFVIITSNQKSQNGLLMNYVIHFWHLFLLWCSQNFVTAASYKHDRYSRVLKTISITVLLLSVIALFLFFQCLFFFFSIFKTKSPNSVWKAETRLVDWCFTITIIIFLIKEAFWWNLSPNLVKLTMCSVVIMTGIRFLSLWTRRLQIWTVCNRNYRPSTWTTLLPHWSFHTWKLAMI